MAGSFNVVVEKTRQSLELSESEEGVGGRGGLRRVWKVKRHLGREKEWHLDRQMAEEKVEQMHL